MMCNIEFKFRGTTYVVPYVVYHCFLDSGTTEHKDLWWLYSHSDIVVNDMGIVMKHRTGLIGGVYDDLWESDRRI